MPSWYAYHSALHTAPKAYQGTLLLLHHVRAKIMPAPVHQGHTRGEWSRAPKTQAGCLAPPMHHGHSGSLASLHRCKGFCALLHCNTETLSCLLGFAIQRKSQISSHHILLCLPITLLSTSCVDSVCRYDCFVGRRKTQKTFLQIDIYKSCLSEDQEVVFPWHDPQLFQVLILPPLSLLPFIST